MICPVRSVVRDDAMKLLMDTPVYVCRRKITTGYATATYQKLVSGAK